jgi:hypothetical protein
MLERQHDAGGIRVAIVMKYNLSDTENGGKAETHVGVKFNNLLWQDYLVTYDNKHRTCENNSDAFSSVEEVHHIILSSYDRT